MAQSQAGPTVIIGIAGFRDRFNSLTVMLGLFKV